MLLNGTLERLEKVDCMNRYLDTTRRHKDVVVVSGNTTMHDGATLTSGNRNTSLIDLYQDVSGGARWMLRTFWMCSSAATFPSNEVTFEEGGRDPWCTSTYLLPNANSWALKSQRTDHELVVKETTIEVDYCLSAGLEPSQEGCAIRYSLVFLIAVTVVNAIKLVCVCITWYIYRRDEKGRAPDRWKQQPLVTQGDAISSFLQHGEEHTRSFRLLEQANCRGKFMTTTGQKRPELDTKLKIQQLQRQARWYRAGGNFRWASTISLYVFSLNLNPYYLANLQPRVLIIIALLMFALFKAIHGLDDHQQLTDLASLWRMGLGREQDYSIAMTQAWDDMGDTSFYVTTLFANGAQFLMSCCWYLGNSLLTAMVLSNHWGMFITKQQRLRVSIPEDGQKSSYFLSLPYRYSLPLLLCSTMIHWLLSQSIFIIQTRGFTYTGEESMGGFARVSSYDASVVGYSAIGLVLCILASGLLMATLILVGLKHLPTYTGDVETDDMAISKLEVRRMPLVSTCSAAISAACQRRIADEDLHLLSLQWGKIGPGKWGFFAGSTQHQSTEERGD